MLERRSARALMAVWLCCWAFGAMPLRSAAAQSPSTLLEEQFRLTVHACDRVIGGAVIDDAAAAAGFILSAPARAADTALGRDSATGVAAFFGADTRIRFARAQQTAGFVVFMVSADGARCEVLGIGQADLGRSAARGLADGAPGWMQASRGQNLHMRRANGDQVTVQQAPGANGAQIVNAHFVRAQAPMTGLAEQVRLSVAACDAIVVGSPIDEATGAISMPLSAPVRATDTTFGNNARAGVAEFFGSDAQVRFVERQVGTEGAVWLWVAPDGDKCQVMSIGEAEALFEGAEAGLAAGALGWRPLDAEQQRRRAEGNWEMQRPNGDAVRLVTMETPQRTKIAIVYFRRGPRT